MRLEKTTMNQEEWQICSDSQSMLIFLIGNGVTSFKNIQLAAADFIASVLPIFEGKYPNDSRPHTALNVMREGVTGIVDEDTRWSALSAVWDSAREHGVGRYQDPIAEAIRILMMHQDPVTEWDVPLVISRICIEVMEDSDKEKESKKQADIIRKYIPNIK